MKNNIVDMPIFSGKISGKTEKKGRFFKNEKSYPLVGYIWFGTIFERERERERETYIRP
jgi:hypothetical protein